MTTRYTHPAGNQGTGDGLSAANAKAITSVLGDMVTGDTLYLLDGTDGQYHVGGVADLTLSSINDWSMLPDPSNTTQVAIRGDVLLDGTWTLESGSVYRQSIGTGKHVPAVLWQYDDAETDVAVSSSNQSSPYEAVRKACFLNNGKTSIAAVEADSGSFWYDTSSGNIYVQAPSNGDADLSATSEVYSYVEGDTAAAHYGLTVSSCNNFTIRDIDIHNFMQGVESSGFMWSLRVAGTSDGGVIDNMLIRHSGRHAIGVVNDSNNIRISNVINIQQHSTTSEQTNNPFVIAATSAGSTDTSGNKFINCKAHCSPCFEAEGSKVVYGVHSSFQGYQIHGDADSTVDDAEFNGCQLIAYNQADSTTYGFQYFQTADPPSFTDDGTIENFPIRVVGLELTPVYVGGGPPTNGNFNDGLFGAALSPTVYQRCLFLIDATGDAPAANEAIAAFGSTTRFDSCAFYVDYGTSSANRLTVFGVADTSGVDVQMNLCSSYVENTNASGTLSPNQFRFEGANATATVKQCVFEAAVEGTSKPVFVRRNDATLNSTLTQCLFSACWYHNFDDSAGVWQDSLNDDTNYNSQGKWKDGPSEDGVAPIDAEIDGAVYDVAPQFAGVSSGDFSPASSDSTIGTRRHWVGSLEHIKDIRGMRYTGRYGAFQMQATRSRDFRARSLVR